MPPVRTPRGFRLWSVRCALDTGVALALGLTPSELEARLATRTLAQIAEQCGVSMTRVRQVAWTIAEPQLAAAVAAGAIAEGEQTAMHQRIDSKRGPWRDLTATAIPARRQVSSSPSSSSSRRAQVPAASEAGKVSSSSSSSLASSSSLGVRGSSVTRASRRTS
jgi:hypothetical protein